MAENSEVSGEVTVAKKKRGPGRPFQPGQSGNPGGRPAVLRDFREKCRRFMEEEGWDLLISIARDPKAKDRRYAIELLANYAYGKPTQGVEVSGPGGGPVAVTHLTPEQIDELYRFVREHSSLEHVSEAPESL